MERKSENVVNLENIEIDIPSDLFKSLENN